LSKATIKRDIENIEKRLLPEKQKRVIIAYHDETTDLYYITEWPKGVGVGLTDAEFNLWCENEPYEMFPVIFRWNAIMKHCEKHGSFWQFQNYRGYGCPLCDLEAGTWKGKVDPKVYFKNVVGAPK
jgi:hypothetical protein